MDEKRWSERLLHRRCRGTSRSCIS